MTQAWLVLTLADGRDVAAPSEAQLAAALAASGLDGAQQQLLAVTARAQEKIRKIQHTKDLIQLTGELLSLAAAIATGKPDKLAKPFETIKHHLDAMDKPG